MSEKRRTVMTNITVTVYTIVLADGSEISWINDKNTRGVRIPVLRDSKDGFRTIKTREDKVDLYKLLLKFIELESEQIKPSDAESRVKNEVAVFKHSEVKCDLDFTWLNVLFYHSEFCSPINMEERVKELIKRNR